MNHDNVINAIPRAYVEELTSKAGAPYHNLVLEFQDGYVLKQYLNPDKKEVVDVHLQRSLDMAKTPAL